MESGGAPRYTMAPVPEFDGFMTSFAGLTVGNGIYRVHEATSGPRADAFVSAAFPEYVNRIECFGFDWLGRQYALDWETVDHDGPSILLFDVTGGSGFKIPRNFVSFHNKLLIEQSEAALVVSGFQKWELENPASIPLPFDRCVVDGTTITNIEQRWIAVTQQRAAAA